MMESEIRLREYERREDLALSDTEALMIRRELKGALTLWPSDEPGCYVARAESFVGFVVLPGGRTLVIEPKVTIETLFALLAAVYDPAKDVFRTEEPQSYTTVESLFEFVVRIFVSYVEDLVARGILRGYRPVVDDPVAVRGRLLFADTLRHRPVLRDRHWCSYSRFTADVAENRILRWAAFCLRPYLYRETGLSGRLHRLGLALSEVELDPEARGLFDTLAFHRLNDPYRPAMALAQLLLDNLTFSGSAGGEPFLAYLLDMNELFEKYVGAVLRRAAGRWDVEVREQDTQHTLDVGKSVTVKPDVVLYHHDEPLLVIDAKYKLKAAREDLYQVLAYCHALELSEAVLVHPTSEQAPGGQVEIRGPGGIRVRYLSLDLRGGPESLEMQGQALANQVEAMLGD